MSFRQPLSLPVVVIALAALACIGSSFFAIPNVRAQELVLVSDATGATTASIQDKIELAQIRLAIRLQEVQVAKAERRLLGAGAEGAVKTLKSKEQELLAREKDLLHLKDLQEKGLVALEKVQQAEQQYLAAAALVTTYRSSGDSYADKLAVHDEKIKLLELRAELARARLNQLKRQLKQ